MGTSRSTSEQFAADRVPTQGYTDDGTGAEAGGYEPQTTAGALWLQLTAD